MRSYLVDIVLHSSALSLAELSRLAQAEPGPGSHDRGQPRVRGQVWEQSILRLHSSLSEDETLGAHLESLWEKAKRLPFVTESSLPATVSLHIEVAVLTDTFTTSVTLEPERLKPFIDAGFTLDLTIYPSSDEKGESRQPCP